MTDEQVRNIAKIEVVEYFDHYLEKIHPKLMEAHSNSCGHGKLLNKLKYVFVGMGITLVLLFPTVGDALINIVSKMKGV